MRWGDEITLIAQKPPDEAVNANGFQNEPEEVRKAIFCNVKSAGYSELNGKRYKVLKTYVNKSGEITELTLSDLPVEGSEEQDSGTEGGGGNGAV